MDGADFLAQAKKRASSQKKKSLPKRTGKATHMARRKASWLRGQEKKDRNRARNEAQHKANVKRGYTIRHAKRHNLPY